MLKELIEYIKEYEGDNELGDYLDTRYVRLTDQHYDQIASAMSDGELELKKSSSCPAERFFLHFNETILFVNKQTENPDASYDVEMVENQGELDDSSELLFASFSLSDDYTPSLKKRASSGKTEDENHQQLVMLSVIPILKGFMVAITD
ncbi:MAG: hypothetical protein CMO25_03055 [Thiotrichales bacterium]|jgi:hypothetical protein|nr:hypothetical protein [Thiotrichales bacterium]MDP6163939.1 hypothetical protein [Candidatus Thioglobus sp.]